MNLDSYVNDADTNDGVMLISHLMEVERVSLSGKWGKERANKIIKDTPQKVIGVYKVTDDVSAAVVKQYMQEDILSFGHSILGA